MACLLVRGKAVHKTMACSNLMDRRMDGSICLLRDRTTKVAPPRGLALRFSPGSPGLPLATRPRPGDSAGVHNKQSTRWGSMSSRP